MKQNITLNDLAVTLEDVLATINAFAQSVDERFDAVDRKFEAVDKRFEAIDKRFETLEGRTGKLASQMVTKDYLDRKLWDLRGDMVAMMDRAVEKHELRFHAA